MPDPDAAEHHLCQLERSLLDPETRKSGRAAELLAEDFIEYGSSGREYRRGDILAALRDETPVRVTADHFQVRPLGPDAALVTYRTHRHSDPPVDSRRSSIWHREPDGQWRMVFHQGTVVPPPG